MGKELHIALQISGKMAGRTLMSKEFGCPMLLILCVSHEHSATQKHANMLETNVKMQIRTPQVNDRNTSAGICPLEHRDKEIITHLSCPFVFVSKLRVLNADV